MSAARIGRVRFKNGPELTILENPLDAVRRNFIADAKALAEGEVAGYAVVTWDRNQNADMGWHAPGMAGDVLPDYVRRVLQRRTNMRDAGRVIKTEMGLPDDDG